jgi:predicted HicB family RNase H-like nuclease
VSRGTRNRNVRVPDELWDTARAKAEAEGRNLSEIIRQALERYVANDSTD